jgi:hypothetical protein
MDFQKIQIMSFLNLTNKVFARPEANFGSSFDKCPSKKSDIPAASLVERLLHAIDQSGN